MKSHILHEINKAFGQNVIDTRPLVRLNEKPYCVQSQQMMIIWPACHWHPTASPFVAG
jgi:hypothetical protein